MTSAKRIRVRDIMRTSFLEIDGLNTVKEAIELMKGSHDNSIIVKKRNEHDEHGILLLSDIAKKVLAKDRAPERVNVYEIMRKPIIGVHPEMDVRYCARLFNDYGLASAPVIDNNLVIGIVGYHGLVLKGLAEIYG